MDRRRLLGGMGVGIALSTAGCLGILDDDGPKDVVERYYEAIEKGDAEAANAVVHPESDTLAVTEADIEDVAIEDGELEEGALSETLRRRFEDDGIDEEQLEALIERQEEAVIGELEAAGFEDYTFVYASVTLESYGEEKRHFTVVEDDGDWYLYD